MSGNGHHSRQRRVSDSSSCDERVKSASVERAKSVCLSRRTSGYGSMDRSGYKQPDGILDDNAGLYFGLHFVGVTPDGIPAMATDHSSGLPSVGLPVEYAEPVTAPSAGRDMFVTVGRHPSSRITNDLMEFDNGMEQAVTTPSRGHSLMAEDRYDALEVKGAVSTDIAVDSAVVNSERDQNKPPQIESLNTRISMVGRKSRFEITEASNEPLVKLRSQHVIKNADAFKRDSAGRRRRSSSLKQDSDFSDINDIACDKNQYDNCFVDRKRRVDSRKPTKDESQSRGNNKGGHGTRGKHKGSRKRDDSSSDDSRPLKTCRD